MLAGKGFDVLNLLGGINAWNGGVAVGDATAGLSLFSGRETVEDVLVVAYALELGLEDFYQKMAEKVSEEDAKKLFLQLSEIESIHRENILKQYRVVSGLAIDHAMFTEKLLPDVVEGGLSTDEYLDLFGDDLEETNNVIGLAMTIEVQALDLYERVVQNSHNQDVKTALGKISAEEKAHLRQLGILLDSLL